MKIKKNTRAFPISPEMRTYHPISKNVLPATPGGERRISNPLFLPQPGQVLCQQQREGVFTTSAGPMLNGTSGNFSQAVFPVLSETPSGDQQKADEQELNAAIHFHF